MKDFELPASTTIGRVHLRVSGLSSSLEFYHDSLGFHQVERDGETVGLSSRPDDRVQLQLTADAGAPPRQTGTTGLYHIAIRLPNRIELGRLLRHLLDRRTRFQGFADHGVSEALYLADPDGNGVELYCDRPRSHWRTRNGQIIMGTERLDLEGLIHEASGDSRPWNGMPDGTAIGHIHLQVSDLSRAEEFYGNLLGLDVTVRSYPGALFMSAGGYHHHLGLNVWAGAGALPPAAGSLGLVSFSLDLPDRGSWEELVERCRQAGIDVDERASAEAVIHDPDGNGVEIRFRPEIL